MHRLVAIFLLVFMPLQLSWAAVSGYCQHESDVSASVQHPGHHEHEHNSGDTLSDTKAPTSKVSNLDGSDTDCASCHAGCCAALGTQIQMTASESPERITASKAEFLFRSALERPERPQWNHLA